VSVRAEPARFDPCAPPLAGVTVLEASAGTGKTHAITAIAARLVAGGVPLSELLLVTFTRMATGELRDRVRGYLVRAEATLVRALAGEAPPEDDAVLAELATGSSAELELRGARLAAALREFDAATITTIHGFCLDVLAQLGIGGDVDRDAAFVEDVSDLVDDAVSDLYVRRFVRWAEQLPFPLAEALRIGRAAVFSPHARVVPDDSPVEAAGGPEMRGRLAHAVRREVDERKRRLGIMTYDDLLTRVRDALADPLVGEDACRRLRERYRHVLVDEFQDTDPIQWEIFRRAFATGESTLVLIGDPKQAIYAFRGADVYAYLEAVRAADRTRTLATSWRSDEPLLRALDTLFEGVQLGHPEIVCRAVEAAPPNRAGGLAGTPVAAPLRVRLLRADSGLADLNDDGRPLPSSVEPAIAADLAADAAELLSSGAEIVRGDADGREPLCPRHVAVLVRTHAQAALVRTALVQAGVPAVEHGAGSVFGSEPALAWLRLLEALERPSATARARVAALTPFLGWSAERIADADQESLEELHATLHRWGALLASRGVAVLLRTISVEQELPRRVLSHAGGERDLTDLGHVGQLLHAQALQEGTGTASLAGWLRARMRDAGEDAEEARVRRLDSDAEAVQVLTVHRSKGLEFPVVLVPFAWQAGWIDPKEPPRFHDGGWQIDVGGRDGDDFVPHRLAGIREQRAEDLRLLYVSLTRARHQAVLWWAGSAASGRSPLARILMGRQAGGFIASEEVCAPRDDAFEERLHELGAERPGCVSVERVEARPPASIAPRAEGREPLAARTLGRTLDRSWTRSSFSRVVSGEWERRVASEQEEELVDDEPAAAPSADGGAAAGGALPLGAMPSSAAVGDLVHRVLQASDFAAPDLEAELLARLEEQRGRRDVAVGESATVAAGLAVALRTPLGALAGGLRLADVARADRLDELPFELPLAGGERPAGVLHPADIAALLEAHLAPDDPLAGYAQRLRAAGLQRPLRGYLTGIVDLVLRARAGGDGRFLVVDYKTNLLAPPGVEARREHYRPDALAEAMAEAHYPLQALFYVVALHRYLRWRVRGYEPERHLGGVLYLFLRGMTGEERGGVFAWRPPAALIEALSDLFDRGARS
jgi:exodeoxyribonuclease V beta subunit